MFFTADHAAARSTLQKFSATAIRHVDEWEKAEPTAATDIRDGT
jgi:hypothetical protein